MSQKTRGEVGISGGHHVFVGVGGTKAVHRLSVVVKEIQYSSEHTHTHCWGATGPVTGTVMS